MSNWANYREVLDQLQVAGLLVDRIEVGTNKAVRCRVKGGGKEKRGWYRLFDFPTDDGRVLITGSFGVWRGDDNGAQKVRLEKVEISPEQRAAMKRRAAEDLRRADEIRKEQAERAAKKADAAWLACSGTGESEYLAKKGVQGYGVRYSKQGSMLIPMLDVGGQIHGLQVIRPPGAKGLGKQYWPPGLDKVGHFHLIGGTPGWILLIAEGYATAATLHAATGYPVVVAFDANNLQAVAKELRKRYPQVKFMFCADDDLFGKCRATVDGQICGARVVLPLDRELCPSCGLPHKCRNTGVDAASSAAIAVANSAWARPQFIDEPEIYQLYRDRGSKLTDYNDLHLREGLHVVRAQIADRLAELGWRAPAREASSSSTGQGEDGRLRPIMTTDELLDRYALVYAHNGAAFDREEHILVSLSDVRDACVNKYVFREWSENPARQIVRIRDVGFDPTGQDPTITCNLFGGWPTTPKAGGCERMLDLLRYICSCDPNADYLYKWVLRWLAYPLQHPGAKMKSTLVLHGPQGAGKNMFFEAYMSIFGPYGRVIGQDAIEDKHNDWASRKLFLIADEVVARSDIFHIKNKLKALITGDWIRINPKHVAAYDERNHCNLVFLSNETRPVVLEEDDRRHCVIWTPPEKPAAYYREVLDEIRNGGIEALHHYLLQLDVGNFTNGERPPITAAKSELIKLSLDSPHRFYDEVYLNAVLGPGVLTGTESDPNPRACVGKTEDWFACYQAWCRATNQKPAPMHMFVNALEKKRGVWCTRVRYKIGQNQFGPHGVLYMTDRREPEGGDKQFWLGDQIVALREILDAYKKGGADG